MDHTFSMADDPP